MWDLLQKFRQLPQNLFYLLHLQTLFPLNRIRSNRQQRTHLTWYAFLFLFSHLTQYQCKQKLVSFRPAQNSYHDFPHCTCTERKMLPSCLPIILVKSKEISASFDYILIFIPHFVLYFHTMKKKNSAIGFPNQPLFFFPPKSALIPTESTDKPTIQSKVLRST